MQDWYFRYIFIIFPVYFLALWLGVSYLIALLGGWRLLVQRFRLQGEFVGQKWFMQSAQMRALIGYRGCLTVGSNGAGLYIRPMVFFRLGHPPLFVPWSEITTRPTRLMLFWNAVEYRLGREEQVPFIVRANLAEKIQAATLQTGAPMPIN